MSIQMQPTYLITIDDLFEQFANPKPYVFIQGENVKQILIDCLRYHYEYLTRSCFSEETKLILNNAFDPHKVMDVCFINLANMFASKRVVSISFEILGLLVLELYFRLMPRLNLLEKNIYNNNTTELRRKVNQAYNTGRLLDMKFKYPFTKRELPCLIENLNIMCHLNPYGLLDSDSIITQCKEKPYPILHKTSNKSLNALLTLADGHLKHIVINNEKIHVEDPLYSSLRLVTVVNPPNVGIDQHVTFSYIHSSAMILSTPINYHAGRLKNIFTSCYILSLKADLRGYEGRIFEHPDVQECYKRSVAIQETQGGIGYDLCITNGHDEFLDAISASAARNKCPYKNRSATATITVAAHDPASLRIINLRHASNITADMRCFFPCIAIPDELMNRSRLGLMWFLFPVYLTFKDAKQHLMFNEYFLSLTPRSRMMMSQFTDDDSLYTLSNERFSLLYNLFQHLGFYESYLPAITYMKAISTACLSSGTPFIFFTDTVNGLKMNTSPLKINGTNLCTEILQPPHNNATCCVLSSIGLREVTLPYHPVINKLGPSKAKNPHIPTIEKVFDLVKLESIVKYIVFILNKLIDDGDYVHESLRIANQEQRPLGIGIQGFYNALATHHLPYPQSRLLGSLLAFINRCARKASAEYAMLHPHIKTQRVLTLEMANLLSERLTREREGQIPFEMEYETQVLANSQFVALMPTSLSGTGNDNVESFEAPISTVVIRQFTNADRFVYVSELAEMLGITSLSPGSFPQLPKWVKFAKDVSFEERISLMKEIAINIDQGSSNNYYCVTNDVNEVLQYIFTAWQANIKTLYYCRSNVPISGLDKSARYSCSTSESCEACKS